jgi:peptidoglycan hydrolase-like protein with peptidoglycan-binding domain
MTRKKYKVVLLHRNLILGKRGRDVTAVQRALVAERIAVDLNVHQLNFIQGSYEQGTLNAMRNFQQRHGLHVDGQYGPNTHKKLAPFFDDYGAWLMNSPVEDTIGVPTSRQKMLAAAMALYNVREHVHYSQSNRMNIVRHQLTPPFTRQEIYEDCSSAYTGICLLAGIPDPNGRKYDGFGYTGTLAKNGKEVASVKVAQVGDAVLYGHGWPYEHVAMYIGNGKVWSHGSENGPYILPIDYRADRKQIRSYL